MKKYIIFVFLFGLISLPVMVLADPTPILLTYVCPTTTGTGVNTLSNFGSRVAGYGTLTIENNPGRAPYFTYAIPANANIPDDISAGNYTSSATSYDPVNAIITCSYTSQTFSPITVSYQLTNGNGGTLNSQTASSISINQYVGVASR